LKIVFNPCPKNVSGPDLKNIDDFVNGNKGFDDVIDDYAKMYADKVMSNKRWRWKDFPGAENLDDIQIAAIRDRAKSLGLIPIVNMKPGTNSPDFESAKQIYEINGKPVIEYLPESKWGLGDTAQFNYLDSQLPGGVRPSGYTWHHSDIPGRFELVPYGIHNSIWHIGGAGPDGWSTGRR